MTRSIPQPFGEPVIGVSEVGAGPTWGQASAVPYTTDNLGEADYRAPGGRVGGPVNDQIIDGEPFDGTAYGDQTVHEGVGAPFGGPQPGRPYA